MKFATPLILLAGYACYSVLSRMTIFFHFFPRLRCVYLLTPIGAERRFYALVQIL